MRSTLVQWERGVPVQCRTPWTCEAIDLSVARRPHPTAWLKDAVALIHKDVAYQVTAGFSTVVFWDDIKTHLHPNFKISPVAVIPQTGRPVQIILDLPFPVQRPPTNKWLWGKPQQSEVVQESINNSTVRLDPDAAVKAIKQVLPRLFQFMADTPEDEIIGFSKIDLSDGFWRMTVEEGQQWNFCYVMPDPPGAPIRIAVPSALQMGWAESPPYFCSATETGRDIIEYLVESKWDLPPHPLEEYVLPAKTAWLTPTQRDKQYIIIAVYVNDYILGAIKSKDRTLIKRVARAALHTIHSLFPPPEITGHVGGKDSVSKKKCDKGDAHLERTKEIMGFLIDREKWMASLPPAKALAIDVEMDKLLPKKHVSLKQMQVIMGKIIHVTQILPTAKAFLTPVYWAMAGDPHQVGPSTKSEVRAALLDLRTMVRDLSRSRTHMAELVSQTAAIGGMCGASSTGVGGIWLLPGQRPMVWRIRWPD
jgi:hypothetical protein